MRYDKVMGCMSIHIDTKRIDENVRRAQNLLDAKVLDDMKEYIPFQQGALRGATQIIEPGLISTNTPYAHYQYVGELYGPNIPIFDSAGNLTGFWSPPHKTGTGRPLHYHTPGTGDHWFERAKQTHGQEWVDLVKREVGRG